MVYRAGVVVDLEVRLVFGGFRRLRFAKVLGLSLMVLVQLGEEGLVRSFWEHALLFQNRQNAHRLFTHTSSIQMFCSHSTLGLQKLLVLEIK